MFFHVLFQIQRYNMPRKYTKKLGGRTYRNYTPQHLQEAVNLVVSRQLSLREASDRYLLTSKLHTEPK